MRSRGGSVQGVDTLSGSETRRPTAEQHPRETRHSPREIRPGNVSFGPALWPRAC